MKTAISIPDHLFEEAEETARRLGVSRSQLYCKAIEAFLEAHRRDGVTARLDEVYAGQDSRLDAVMARMQELSLPRDEWDETR
jgi:metal-responsive CopG/Arc/MetJ family transcriptional regulator